MSREGRASVVDGERERTQNGVEVLSILNALDLMSQVLFECLDKRNAL